MSSEAKIGLGIVLGAVLVSVVMIGRMVTRKTEPVRLGGAPVAAAPADEPPAGPESWDAAPVGPRELVAPGGVGMGGDSMTRLVDGGASAAPASHPAPAGPSSPIAEAPVATPMTTPSAAPVAVPLSVPVAEPLKSPAPDSFGVPPSPAGKIYTVKRGDSLVAIARRNYGSSRKADLIVKANPGVDFNKPLAIGTKLAMPEDAGRAALPAAAAEAPASTPTLAPAAVSGRVHKVQAGDNLWSLADRYLGKSSRYTEILAANPGLTKDSVLKIGQKIVIPEASGR